MIPQLAFDPYILLQASCRASLLVSNGGFSRDDWEDLRQEMVLDCLERTPRFDPARGDWRGFVRGVVRHHSAVLAKRESQRIRFEPLGVAGEEADAGDDLEREIFEAGFDPASEDPTAALALSADVQRVVASLPDNLRTLASDLTEMTVAEVAAKRGRSTQWIYHLMKRLRRAFVQAGVTPDSMRRRGGTR
jgi:RNA polymerase sigma-70 factor (ECF subfamily)